MHGLISFDMNDPIDKLAWDLISTPEFQRLRRVKQLGVSEYTFPGATHNRFSHSIGVFHLARRLMNIVKRTLKDDHKEVDDYKSRVALIAALVHDLGHGPFSHAFEQVEKTRLSKQLGAYQNHEKWTAQIIQNPDGGIYKTIKRHENGGMADDVAELLTSDPEHIYASVVSSSFDADRLDFLQRDRLMTGSQAGGIDFDWLLDNLQIAYDVPIIDEDSEETGPLPEEEIQTIQTLCFREKAVQAAEAFIVARYHLYSQVYFHKTTRGVEQLLKAFLLELANQVKSGNISGTGIWAKHPLIAYYKTKKRTVQQYLSLDDTVVWSAIHAAIHGKNEKLKLFADRLLNRKLMKVISIETSKPTETDKMRRKYISDKYKDMLGNTIFEDRVPLSVYSIEDKERVNPHKKVRIKRDSDNSSVDIVSISKIVHALTDKQETLRYYFIDESIYNIVNKIGGE